MAHSIEMLSYMYIAALLHRRLWTISRRNNFETFALHMHSPQLGYFVMHHAFQNINECSL